MRTFNSTNNRRLANFDQFSFFKQEENRRLTDEIDFLRRQLQIDKEKMHLLEETLENLKNQGLINAGTSKNRLHQRSFSSFFLHRLCEYNASNEYNEFIR